jgi:hypothetical protein
MSATVFAPVWPKTNLVQSNPFPDYEKFSFQHAKKPYLEFPILESGAYNDNGSPGADRVVIGSIATDYNSAVFYAVIPHDGSTKNWFTERKDDTVNTSGKGTWDTEKTKGRGREPGRGRQLLGRIDLYGRLYVSLQPNSSDQYQS